MGRNYSTTQQRCKKHPSHKQSKGVCPSCLREKLSQLSSSSSSTANHSNSSTYSSLSPCSDDSDLSSPGSPSLHKMMAKNKSFSFLLMRSSNHKPLMEKSRSLAFVVEEEEKKEKKKKKGFWSKLLLGKRKEEDHHMLHLKTVKEKSSTKWVLFS